MKIDKIQALRGPNIWSVQRTPVVCLLAWVQCCFRQALHAGARAARRCLDARAQGQAHQADVG